MVQDNSAEAEDSIEAQVAACRAMYPGESVEEEEDKVSDNSDDDEENASLEDSKSSKKDLQPHRSKTILASKLVVLAVLISSAAIAGFFTYQFSSQQETEDFEKQVRQKSLLLRITSIAIHGLSCLSNLL